MIPKTIHYCWFGGNPLPDSAKKCIASWRKFFPDYEIKEWNESNYDVRKNSYLSIAYDIKKYAFVSDYARMDILYHYGGVYFDTDVEVVNRFDDLMIHGGFMGWENEANVNPGLGMAVHAGSPILREVMDFYEQFSQDDREKIIHQGYIVPVTTRVLMDHGLKQRSEIQTVDDIGIYPVEYFNPLDSVTGVLRKTEKTHSIHWYMASWLPKHKQLVSKVTQFCHRRFGSDCFRWLHELRK